MPETLSTDSSSLAVSQSAFELLGEEFLTTEQVAALTKTKERTVCSWREVGGGPPYTKLGRVVLYRKSALLQWLLKREVTPRKSRKAAR